MKRLSLACAVALVLLAGCLLPGRNGPVLLVPPLPPFVELGAEPYFYQGGYHYFYENERWSWSDSRNGPRAELPRDHYPREVRFKDRGEGRGHGGRD